MGLPIERREVLGSSPGRTSIFFLLAKGLQKVGKSMRHLFKSRGVVVSLLQKECELSRTLISLDISGLRTNRVAIKKRGWGRGIKSEREREEKSFVRTTDIRNALLSFPMSGHSRATWLLTVIWPTCASFFIFFRDVSPCYFMA